MITIPESTSLVAVDWGSSQRRTFMLDDAGTVLARHADAAGVLTLEPGGAAQAFSALRAACGDTTILMAGMIGSDRGLVQVPYTCCPASMSNIIKGLVWIDDRAAILPGVAYRENMRCDVMRGEEVQILGALSANMLPHDALVCQPGTHNKWVTVEGGEIRGFRTAMSGEIFALLCGSGTLAPQLKDPVEFGQAFIDGVKLGLNGRGAIAEIFSVRAGLLLGELEREQSSSFLSGILIGDDIRAGVFEAMKPGDTVHVLGHGLLTTLFVKALGVAGCNAKLIDSESAFLAGMISIQKAIL